MRLYRILRKAWLSLPPQTWWGVYTLIFTMLVLFLLLAFLGHYLKGTLP